MARLAGLVAQLARGRGGVVWLDGKSALLRSMLSVAQEAGCEVFATAADEVLCRIPGRLIVDCLTGESGALAKRSPDVSALIAGFAAATGQRVADSASAVAEAAVSTVERICAVGPVVIVVDDLHWADEVSLLVWRL